MLTWDRDFASMTRRIGEKMQERKNPTARHGTSIVAVLSCLPCALVAANDFPTQARVEYVLGCMASHGGQNYETMYSCVCMIDRIATEMSYDDYTESEVFTQMRTTPGERSGMFRGPGSQVQRLSDVTAAAEQSCFIRKPTDGATNASEKS